MTTDFHLIPEPRQEPDIERFVAALLAFVLTRMAEEAAAASADEEGEADA